MTEAQMGWESLMHTDAPQGCALRAALFTSYDAPDERLLAEHLLPLLLRVSRDPAVDGGQRAQFLLELDERLKHLHGRLVVVSSSQSSKTQQEEADSSYPWIWQCIQRLSVGRGTNAVQHAKLWMMHWGASDQKGQVGVADEGEPEYLELVVSSANLTLDAFKGQIQAVWRVFLPLHATGVESRARGWGILPAFIAALGESAANTPAMVVFHDLLKRADCPAGTSFVASVPGKHSPQVLRRTPWGAAGLSGIALAGRGAVKVSVLTPYVGSWTIDGLEQWCARFGGTAKQLGLLWIAKHHPWAQQWHLSTSSFGALAQAGSKVLELPYRPGEAKRLYPFHKDHRNVDERWSHAKLYVFQRGNSKSLLLTSTNFSQAAWGREDKSGSLVIENFELGVCVKGGQWPFAGLSPFQDAEDLAITDSPDARIYLYIFWASAFWDGKLIHIECRWRYEFPLRAEVQCGEAWEAVDQWKAVAGEPTRKAVKRWANSKRRPLLLRLTCEDQSILLPVYDKRPQDERDTSFPPELDESVVQAMKDALLFERFGGRLAPDELGSAFAETDPKKKPPVEVDVPDESYAVPAVEFARRQLAIVDNWATQLRRAKNSPTLAESYHYLRLDGEQLSAAFGRIVERECAVRPMLAVGARLALQEMALRLKVDRDIG